VIDNALSNVMFNDGFIEIFIWADGKRQKAKVVYINGLDCFHLLLASALGLLPFLLITPGLRSETNNLCTKMMALYDP